MIFWWRALLMALLGLLASACSNQVISEAPWFALDGTNEIASINNGVWLRVAGPSNSVSPQGEVRARADDICRFNRNRPVSRWPDCAEWHVVRGRQILEYGLVVENDVQEPGRYVWRPVEPVIAAGNPLLMQFGQCPVSESDLTGQQVIGRDEETRMAYCYRAMEPVDRNLDGLIISYDSWPIYCGPFPEDGGGGVTAAPWPGLTVRGQMCVAENQTALRNAARLSRSLAQENNGIERFVWLREGYQ